MKKLIATVLAAIMLVPVAMATNLGEFPGFLATKTDTTSRVNAYVIVGRNAAASDVLGGIDLATRIAELNYDVVSVPGGVAIGCEYGTCKKGEVYLNTAYINNTMGNELTTAIGLGVKKITYGGTEYPVTEKVGVPQKVVIAGGTSVNGSIGIDLGTTAGALYYELDLPFINATQFSYINPLKIKLFGQEFQITAVGSDTFTALTGSVGLADSVTPTGVTYGEYTAYVIDGESHSWAQIVIKDSAGNQLASDIINVGSTGTFTIGTTTLKVKVLDVWGSAISGRVSAKLVVGEEIDKIYSNGDSFPGNDLWVFDIRTGADYLQSIRLNYAPNETANQVVPLGGKIVAPNDYFEFGLQDLLVKTFTTVTFSADLVSVYANATATTPIFSNKPAIKIEATDYVFNGQNSKKAYIAFDGTKYYVAYYDEVLGRAINASDALYGGSLASISGQFDSHSFTINATNTTTSNFTGVWLTDGGSKTVKMAYNFTSATAAPILGTSSSSEDADVISWANENVGNYENSDLISTYGSVLKANIKTNAGAQKVVFELPAEQQKAFVYMGKIGEITTAGGTYNKVVSVLTPIAKTATEAGTEKTTTKAFVLVGGPCANPLVAELANAGLLKDKNGVNLTCDGWIGTGRNFGLISVIDDAFGVTGKVALVVAGTRAEDTRLAAQYLQADKLKGSTAKAVEVTGTSVATATVETIS
ncbi:MAG: S-layer protein [Candidatus Aenigmatarchaeota archaeon]